MKTTQQLFMTMVAVLAVVMMGAGLGAGGEERISKVSRNTRPQAARGELVKLVSGNTAFAFDLYQRLKGESGNLVYSPYSISMALAMTDAGARGGTEKEMAKVLHFTLPPDRLHPAFDALDLDIMDRASSGKEFKLNIANALWAQRGYNFLPAFLDTLAANYGAGVRLANFHKDPEKARAAINDWVNRQTQGMIKELMGPRTVTTATRLVLANAIYFKGVWMSTFEKRRTAREKFFLADGKSVMVPMMHQSPKHFQYAEGDGYQAVELPYRGNQIAMVIFLPKNIEAFERALTADKMEKAMKQMSSRRIVLAMPKFKYDSGFSLNQTLAAMGMGSAFVFGRADFSGMEPRKELYISDVIHKAQVRVDEDGTEAAAATAVGMMAGAMRNEEPVLELTIDRPFVYLIRDVKTGSLLFVGRVMEPKE